MEAPHGFTTMSTPPIPTSTAAASTAIQMLLPKERKLKARTTFTMAKRMRTTPSATEKNPAITFGKINAMSAMMI